MVNRVDSSNSEKLLKKALDDINMLAEPAFGYTPLRGDAFLYDLWELIKSISSADSTHPQTSTITR